MVDTVNYFLSCEKRLNCVIDYLPVAYRNVLSAIPLSKKELESLSVAYCIGQPFFSVRELKDRLPTHSYKRVYDAVRSLLAEGYLTQVKPFEQRIYKKKSGIANRAAVYSVSFKGEELMKDFVRRIKEELEKAEHGYL